MFSFRVKSNLKIILNNSRLIWDLKVQKHGVLIWRKRGTSYYLMDENHAWLHNGNLNWLVAGLSLAKKHEGFSMIWRLMKIECMKSWLDFFDTLAMLNKRVELMGRWTLEDRQEHSSRIRAKILDIPSKHSWNCLSTRKTQSMVLPSTAVAVNCKDMSLRRNFKS